MSRCRQLILGLIFTFGAFATYNIASAADPAFCTQYANVADKNVKIAKQFKCGFQGPRWSKGTAGHFG